MDILRKINKMRIDRGWSIYRLSVESDVPQSTLTNMFNRETLPSITTLASICRAFDISLSEFFMEEKAQTESSTREKEFLDIFNSLSYEVQESVLCIRREMKKKR